MNQLQKNIIALSMLMLLVVGSVTVYFVIQNSSGPRPNTNNGIITPEEVNFSQRGNVFKNNPGFRPGTWYLSYGEPGKPGASVELQFNSQSPDLQAGEKVYIEGYQTEEVVAVSKLEILNAYKRNVIWVESPLPNDTVINPITITGWAKGNWYFEASFPIKVLDANGKVLGQVAATAQGDWMVDEYVQFMASLQFSTPTTTTGTLVLEKDNPSGLPQNVDELRIPITFGTEARDVKLYYYNPNKDKDVNGNLLCSRQGLASVERQIPITNTPLEDTIRLLLQGKITDEEKSQGISTEYPLSGFELKSANQSNTALTLEFVDPQNKTGGGSCRVGVLWFQIEATAKQFPGVKEVTFKPEELFQP